MNILKLSIGSPPIEFNIPIISFNPATDIRYGWKFEDKINGLAQNDGITAFGEVLAKAASFSPYQGSSHN
jgi:hypothetical protein